jgi:exodeoxyribonuclease VII large subunit
LENGQQIIASGKLSLYEARGDYQLIVEELKEAGQGDLYRQFELLKIKLQALGLFDSTRKKPIPVFPNTIGVITSASGAALKDILITLNRRYPIANVEIYPCEVQGKNAARQLIAAVNKANNDKQYDVLILARGGGSIEDLWAFNDEKLAYAIVKSDIPIITGIGHETDFTIADFVADLRAATPTAAAEAASPDQLEMQIQIKAIQTRLIAAIARFIQHQKLLLKHEIQKINSPEQLISTHWQTIDYLHNNLLRNINYLLSQKRHRWHMASMGLQSQNPARLLTESRKKLKTIEDDLIRKITLQINQKKQKLTKIIATLKAVSPLATLDRGYAIVSHHDKILLDSSQVKGNDIVNIRLAKGLLTGKIISKQNNSAN